MSLGSRSMRHIANSRSPPLRSSRLVRFPGTISRALFPRHYVVVVVQVPIAHYRTHVRRAGGRSRHRTGEPSRFGKPVVAHGRSDLAERREVGGIESAANQ